jgi:hypothetical protein
MKVIRLENVITMLKEYTDFTGEMELKEKRTPNHGRCCTCQECGWPHDGDCVCEHNYFVGWLSECTEDI